MLILKYKGELVSWKKAQRFDKKVNLFRPVSRVGAEATLVPLDGFCVDAVRQWLSERETLRFDIPTPLAFPGPDGSRLSGVSIFKAIRGALKGIGYQGSQSGASVLRTTWCQRQVLAGCETELLQRRMGLRTPKTINQTRLHASQT
jgi:integrase/recombinase XerD